MTITLSDKQRNFLPWLTSQRERMVSLTGYAGTGKTTLMKHLNDNLPAVQWLATTNAAAHILGNSLGHSNVLTVDSAMGMQPQIKHGETIYLPTGRPKIARNGWIVIDEASMLNSQRLQLLEQSCVRNILFVGDDFQIPPVKEIVSPVYRMGLPTYHLTEVFRQSAGAILNLATDVRLHGLDYSWSMIDEYGINKLGMKDLDQFYAAFPMGIVLCPTHSTKDYCNTVARKMFNGGNPALFKGEILTLEEPLQGVSAPKRGSRVKITNNPVQLKFRGFMVWDVELDNEYNIYVPADADERKRVMNRKREIKREYDNSKSTNEKGLLDAELAMLSAKIGFMTTGFAQTIHSAQGNGYDDVMIATPGLRQYFKNHDIRIRMVYTAITRAKKTLTIGV